MVIIPTSKKRDANQKLTDPLPYEDTAHVWKPVLVWSFLRVEGLGFRVDLETRVANTATIKN